ncbi:hypothetical protein JVT61DRAFT_13621 [Boletus reticuloceps]|uniref:DUF6532 domain-containing protein n=1 Tax=Boletus reticuloceps TaxID=495285 RepID=A0A8I3A2X5_9AGAM|nr:hypothetical protein JVT61DRAFT_13621 [Boletus reticuloceps]
MTGHSQLLCTIPDDSNIDPAVATEDYNILLSLLRIMTCAIMFILFPNICEINPMLPLEMNYASSNNSDARDVVREYHQCNRFPCPLDPSALHDICLQHQVARPKVHQNGAPPLPSIPSQALLPQAQVQVPPPAQAVHMPPQVPSVDAAAGPLDGPATKLRTYPISFCPLIEHAKLIAQCNCASVNPFTSHLEFLDQRCVEYFNEALAETPNVLQGYWPQYWKDLSVLLWEAMMSWHSTLKAKAREIMPRFYALSEDHSPAENKAEAQMLIRHSTFTFDDVDEEGSTNNMAAPALGALIVSFFYNGPSSLAVLFSDVFAGKVPQGVQEDRKFEYQGYSKIYAQFHSMQLAINEDLKHAAKTQALRIAWVNSADVPANEPGNIITFEDDF